MKPYRGVPFFWGYPWGYFFVLRDHFFDEVIMKLTDTKVREAKPRAGKVDPPSSSFIVQNTLSLSAVRERKGEWNVGVIDDRSTAPQ